MAKKNTENSEEKRKLDKQSLRRLMGIFRFMLPYKWPFIAGMACLFVSSAFSLAFPELMGQLIDVAKGGDASYFFDNMGEITIMLVVILLVQSLFSFLRIYLFAIVSEPAMADIRKALYAKFMDMPMSFYDQKRTGELMSRISADVSTLQEAFSINLAELVRQVVVLVVGIAMLFYKTAELTVFMLLTIPVLVIIAMVFGRYIRKLSKQAQDALAQTNIVVEETLQAIQMVKAFANEQFENKRYAEAMKETVQLSIRTGLFREASFLFLIFALFSGIVGVVWYGASLVSKGEITIGTLISFVMYTLFIGGSVAGLGTIYSAIQRAIGASERVLEILNAQGEPRSSVSTPIHNRFQGEISLHDVRFSYPTRADVEVLKGVSMHIAPGQRIALVGHSSAGKSTIVQLLLRFYPWSAGSIYIDGQDAQHYDLHSYRQNMALVPQEVILFGGSIKENIAYGRPGASEEEIIEAAKQANALQFIQSFPEGLNTIVGERGVKLSGGQRQRIAIARAILKNPAVLLLDEATSSLDAESEQLVQQALDKLMEGRTSIIIAHRLSTIRNADCIYVLDGGRIVEQGKHEELVKIEEGIYSNLVKLQFSYT